MKILSLEDRYLAFSSEIHAEGSNTAPSYVAALKKIDTALHLHGVFLAPNESVWEIRDVERLAALYEFVKSEQKKSDGGVFCNGRLVHIVLYGRDVRNMMVYFFLLLHFTFREIFCII